MVAPAQGGIRHGVGVRSGGRWRSRDRLTRQPRPPPHLTPIFLSHRHDLPRPALRAPSPLSGPPARSQPGPPRRPARPGPCARRRCRRRPGTMRANVSGRASGLCKCPTACENPPLPPPRLPPPERGWRPGPGGGGRPCIGMSCLPGAPARDRALLSPCRRLIADRSSPARGGRKKATQTTPWGQAGVVTCSLHTYSSPQRALTLGSDLGGPPTWHPTHTNQFISEPRLLEVKPSL